MSDDVEVEVDEKYLEPGYWAATLAAYEDDLAEDLPPDAASASIEDVSRMLRRIRILSYRVAEYDDLHVVEMQRLNARRDDLVGPLVRQIAALETTLRQYALRAFQDFGKTMIATPNGVLKGSRPLLPELDVVDAKVAAWVRPINCTVVQDKPKVVKGMLRELLDSFEDKGVFRRAIVTGGPVTGATIVGTLGLLEVGQEWLRPFPDGAVGVYVEKVNDQWKVLPGLTWKPAGEQGSGRTFTVVVA